MRSPYACKWVNRAQVAAVIFLVALLASESNAEQQGEAGGFGVRSVGINLVSAHDSGSVHDYTCQCAWRKPAIVPLAAPSVTWHVTNHLGARITLLTGLLVKQESAMHLSFVYYL